MSKSLYCVIVSITIVTAYSCAKIGSPFGGPKDETPPKVVKAKPPVNTVNFEAQKKIVITFDEYIQVENIFQELVVSPPIEGRVMAQVKGKSLEVEFPPEVVFDTVTYTLDFGNSIVDFNEGNILAGYRYVFSLKDYIDSMNVEGKIVSAFDHQPDKDRMLVMLYKNMNDSAPYLEKPRYVCRSDEQGNFFMHNIETGIYRLFALKDANFNMLYDLPSEQIAFSDSLIKLTAERFQDNIIIDDTLLTNKIPNDTISKDLINTDTVGIIDTLYTGFKPEHEYISSTDSLVSDSVLTDSLLEDQKYYALYTELFFFTREVKNQYMTNYLRPLREQLLFTFNEPLADTFEIYPLNYAPSEFDWFLLDASRETDTLKFWITDTSMLALDTLQMEVCYPMFDSSGIQYYQVDTLLMMVEQKKATRGRRERLRPQKEEVEEQAPETPKIIIQHNIKNTGAFDLDKRIALISPRPLAEVLTERIELFRIQDTLEFPVKTKIERDTNSFYRILIDYVPEGSTMYKVFIPDSTFFDIYATTNDTTIFQFTTQADDYYGALTLRLNGVKEPILLQLLDDKEKLLIEKKIFSNETIRYNFLYPKKYLLKVVVDANGNGKWDTGDYLNHIQPERVIYYQQVIDIRSNWEMDFIWDLSAEN